MRKVIFVLFCFSVLCLLPSCGGKKDKTPTIGYEILVSTFANGDSENDDKENGVYGDIKGITENLDYLNDDLGVDCLWLTPIHESASYSKYDVDDYYSIDDQFGLMDDYKDLLKQAHKRGMTVLLDLVINHTSTEHKWFKQALSNVDDYRDYYRFSDVGGTHFYKGGGAFYYAYFWDQMPDLNFDNEATYNDMLDVCNFWLDLGVDGFRIDGAKHVYNTDGSMETPTAEEDNIEFFQKLYKDIKLIDNDAFVLLEVFDSNSNYVSQFYKGCDSTFNFSMADRIAKAVSSGNSEMISGTYSYIDKTYSAVKEDYVDSIILSNHDRERILTKLNLDDDLAKVAASISFTLPGCTWIYYGDELGMSGGSIGSTHGDLGYRQPFKWGGSSYQTGELSVKASGFTYTNEYDDHNKELKSVREQKRIKNSMLNHYIDWAGLKQEDDVLKYGDFKDVTLDKAIYSFERSYNGKTYLILHNLKGEEVTFDCEASKASLVYGDAKFVNGKITIPANSSAVYSISKSIAKDDDVQISSDMNLYVYSPLSVPTFYFWDVVGSAAKTSWPGEDMVDCGDGWYSYKLAGASFANVIFANVDGKQTDDLTCKGGTYYFVYENNKFGAKGGRMGNWYTEKPTV